jgi:hypothetical protein
VRRLELRDLDRNLRADVRRDLLAVDDYRVLGRRSGRRAHHHRAAAGGGGRPLLGRLHAEAECHRAAQRPGEVISPAATVQPACLP